jgi:type II secretion system protein L
MAKKILGLDICSDGIGAVLLKRGVKSHVVEACAHINLAQTDDFEVVLAAGLEKLRTQMEIDDVICAASFPAERISYRHVQVPFRAPRKIRQVLPFELEPSLPFAVEETVWAYQSLGGNQQNTLLAAAALKSEFDACLACLNRYGLDPVSVSPAGYTLAMLLAAQMKGQTEDTGDWLLIDIGRQSVTLYLLAEGRIQAIRALAGRTTYPWSIESAATAIRQTLHAFSERKTGGYAPRQAFVTGYDLLDVNLESELSSLLALPVKRTDLPGSLPVTIGSHAGEQWRSHRMDKALALAFASFGASGRQILDFREGSAPRIRFWSQNRRQLITAALLAGLVLCLMGADLLTQTHVLEQRLNRLNSSITEVFRSTFPEVKNIVDPLQQMRVKLNEIDRRLPDGLNTRPPVIEILDDISRRIPANIDVVFSRMVIGNDNVQISAETGTFNAVDEIKSRLAGSDRFSKVDITSATMDKTSKRVRFKLKLHLA